MRAWALCQGNPLKFKFIHDHRNEFNLEIMCQTLEVSKSGYYAAQKRPESQRITNRGILAEKIKLIHANSRNTYGSARVHAVLLENTERCSRPRVASIMRDHGLTGKRKGKVRQITTDSTHGHAIAENRLEREFDAEKPNQKWVADITYLPTTEGWLYLAAVLDLHSRRVVGWSMSDSLESQVVLDALEMARISRKPSAGLVYHSDRGVQRPRPSGACLGVKTVRSGCSPRCTRANRCSLEYEPQR